MIIDLWHFFLVLVIIFNIIILKKKNKRNRLKKYWLYGTVKCVGEELLSKFIVDGAQVCLKFFNCVDAVLQKSIIEKKMWNHENEKKNSAADLSKHNHHVLIFTGLQKKINLKRMEQDWMIIEHWTTKGIYVMQFLDFWYVWWM